jgi:polyisoprenoid-binding protein YceI
MKKILFPMLIILQAKFLPAQYKPVDQGSEVNFTVTNFGFDVSGSFTGLQGSIRIDQQNPANDSFDISIDANTVNTDNHMRDTHLRDEGYLDVKNHPRIRLVSTQVRATTRNGVYQLTGQLTMKGKTKNISFPFTMMSAGDSLLFTGTLAINRKDFEVGGTSTIGNEVRINLKVLTTKL